MSEKRQHRKAAEAAIQHMHFDSNSDEDEFVETYEISESSEDEEYQETIKSKKKTSRKCVNIMPYQDVRNKSAIVTYKNCHAIIGDDIISDESETEDLHLFSESEGEDTIKYVIKKSAHHYDVPLLEEPAFGLEDLCRLCAEKQDSMVTIFGEEGTQLDLQNKINSLLPIKVEKSDWLPLVLCRGCVNLVNQSYGLLSASQEADETLRKMFKQQRQLFQDNDEASRDSPTHSTSGDEENNSLSADAETIHVDKEYDSDGTETVIPSIPVATAPKKRKCSLGILLSPSATLQNISSDNTEPKKVKIQELVPEENQSIDKMDFSIYQQEVEIDAIECKLCETYHPRFSKYKQHMIERHNIYICKTHPEFQGNSAAELKNHMRKCVSFLCATCGKSYNNKYHLKRHSLLHDEAKFCCEICGRNFYHKTDLIKHRNVHDEVGQFKCNICDRRFKHRKNLTTHQHKIHSNIWTYHCKMCPVVCSTPIEITEHCNQHDDVLKSNIVNRKLFKIKLVETN